ncbi:PH domain-containing protein [Nocardioides sp. GCM10027113]|uniref:PH domain-containing protein n=1 Tax=unclassified Nocardioides TaxID=2615069 RepID=UPI00362247E7
MSEPLTAGPGVPWQRLDPRMLLVYPLREVLRFLPVLLGLFIAGSASGRMDLRWQLLGITIPLLVGLLRYATTSFRIHAGTVELRRGVVDRHRLSARVERVRTVELTASPLHRLLGLTTVRIGTGTASTREEDSLDLDGLPVARARDLRESLLGAAVRSRGPEPEGEGDVPTVQAARVVLTFDPRWARFAPLTSAGVVLAAGVLGVGSQVLEGLGAFDDPELGSVDDPGVLEAVEWLVVIPATVVIGAVVVSALAVAAYLVTHGGLRLSHSDADGAWHLRRGLLTTRETTLDDHRVTGVSVVEPLGLRLAGGARLAAIVTGLRRDESTSAMLVPPAPVAVVRRTAGAVVGDPAAATGPLRGHGPRARTRRWTRALVPVLVVAAALAAASVAAGRVWPALVGLALLPLAALLAEDRTRALGHALTPTHLVSRSGSLLRRRQVLRTDAVIGWNQRATWFQRRAGLTTLVATTAGGSQAVVVLDVPEDEAVALAAAATPGLLEQFLD